MRERRGAARLGSRKKLASEERELLRARGAAAGAAAGGVAAAGVRSPGGVRGGQTLGFEPHAQAGGRRCDEGIAPADKSKAFLALALFVLPLGRVSP